jgi:hypothetical protein
VRVSQALLPARKSPDFLAGTIASGKAGVQRTQSFAFLPFPLKDAEPLIINVLLLTAPIVLIGILAVVVVTIFGW